MATAVKELDKTAILALLDRVMDPEIPVVSITDLGIVRSIEDDPPRVRISPTYTGCPATVAIEMLIREALEGLQAGFAAPLRLARRGAEAANLFGVHRAALGAFGFR